jgi:hypothetical protein
MAKKIGLAGVEGGPRRIAAEHANWTSFKVRHNIDGPSSSSSTPSATSGRCLRASSTTSRATADRPEHHELLANDPAADPPGAALSGVPMATNVGYLDSTAATTRSSTRSHPDDVRASPATITAQAAAEAAQGPGGSSRSGSEGLRLRPQRPCGRPHQHLPLEAGGQALPLRHQIGCSPEKCARGHLPWMPRGRGGPIVAPGAVQRAPDAGGPMAPWRSSSGPPGAKNPKLRASVEPSSAAVDAWPAAMTLATSSK